MPLFDDLVALYAGDQDEIHAGEDAPLPDAPSGDAHGDEEFQAHFQEILQLGPETPEFQEALAKLLEANPDKAGQLIEEIGQQHPELLQQMEQGGAENEQAPSEAPQPQPGEQNACMGAMNGFMPQSKVPSRPPPSAHGKVQYSIPGRAVRTVGRTAHVAAHVLNPAYGLARVGRYISGYQVRAEDETGAVVYQQDFPFSIPNVGPRAEANARHVQDIFPECVVYLDAMPGEQAESPAAPETYDQAQPPPGFREWMANFANLLRTNPAFAAMLGHHDDMAAPALPEPGEQNDAADAILGGAESLVPDPTPGGPIAGLTGAAHAGAGQFGKAPSLGIPDRLSPNSPPMGPDYGKPGALTPPATPAPAAKVSKPGAINWGSSPPPAVTSPHQQARELVLGRQAASRGAERASATAAMDAGMRQVQQTTDHVQAIKARLPTPGLATTKTKRE